MKIYQWNQFMYTYRKIALLLMAPRFGLQKQVIVS